MLGINIVLVDSDALIGLNNITDANHQRYQRIAEYLAKNDLNTIVPYPILLEAATALARGSKINRPDIAAKILQDYAKTEGKVALDENISSETSVSFSNNTSRKNTPFDHYLCALAKKNNIKYVFSFDSFYKKQGLVLAEDLLN